MTRQAFDAARGDGHFLDLLWGGFPRCRCAACRDGEDGVFKGRRGILMQSRRDAECAEGQQAGRSVSGNLSLDGTFLVENFRIEFSK